MARHPSRPTTLDYVERLFTDFVELHGDRAFGDDRAIHTGFARLGDYRVMLIGGAQGVASLSAATLPADTIFTFTTAATSVIGTWSLDEGTGTLAADSSGNGNHGVVEGGAAWMAGPIGSACVYRPATARNRGSSCISVRS